MAESTPIRESGHEGLMRKIIVGIFRWIGEWVAEVAIVKIWPFIIAGLVVIAGAFECLPWAYVITAASLAFGGVFWGLNNAHAWRTRLVEEESLITEGVEFQPAMYTDANNDLGVRATIHVKNKAAYAITSALEKADFFLMKYNGLDRRDAVGTIDKNTNKIAGESTDRFRSCAVMIEDLKSEPHIMGEFHAKLRYGRKTLNHVLHIDLKVIGTRQVDGTWTFQGNKILG